MERAKERAAAAAAKPRRGRPRKSAAEKSARRAEIMNAAIRLFSEQSYRETTMSDIARSLGLNQSSLYYWFKDKEDLLEAILEENQSSLRLASMVSAPPGENLMHLYSVVYTDTLMMCSSPFDYFELEEAALAHPERFKSFFDTYRTLGQAIEQIVGRCVEEGELPGRTVPSLATSVVLSLTEGLQHQHHQAMLNAADVAGAWGGLVTRTGEELARIAADNAVKALADDPDVGALYEGAVARGWIAPPKKKPASPAKRRAKR